MARNPLLAAALGVAVLSTSVAVAQTPTLGDIARKEQERRKALKAPAKVLTTQEMPKPPAAPALPSAAAKPGAADSKDQPKPDELEKDEAWWKGRITQPREELRRNEMFAAALQTRINSLSADFTARDDPYQRARIGEDRVKALAELDRVKADIELLKKKIADIEEEGRRAGIPPGWLR